MSHLTHGLSVLVSVIRAGDDLRISFADTSSLKRGITQLKSDEASKSRLATVTFLQPRGKRKDPPIASIGVSSCPSGGSIGQAHTEYGLIAEPPADSQCHPCFEPRRFHVVDHQANIEDSLTSLRETEQVTRAEAIGPRYAELSGRIANNIVEMIAAATGVHVRKSTGVSRGAKRTLRPEKISISTFVTNRLGGWSLRTMRESFYGAKQVVGQIRGSNAKLERRFDEL